MELPDDALCTFCGKSQRQTAYLIAGPAVWICDECVALCVEILEENLGRDWNRVRSGESQVDIFAATATSNRPRPNPPTTN